MRHISAFAQNLIKTYNPIRPVRWSMAAAAALVLSIFTISSVTAQENNFQSQGSFFSFSSPGAFENSFGFGFNQNASNFQFFGGGSVCETDVNGTVCTTVGVTSAQNCSQLQCGTGSRCFQGLDGARCVPDNTDDSGAPLTCADVSCGADRHCTDSSTGPQCRPVDPTPEPTLTCANVECMPGNRCVESSSGPQCLPVDPEPEPTLTCANVECMPGHRCVESSSGPQCLPVDPEPEPTLSCANVLCTTGHRCVETSNGPQCVRPSVCQCVRAPCNCGNIGQLPTTGGFAQDAYNSIEQARQRIYNVRRNFQGFTPRD